MADTGLLVDISDPGGGDCGGNLGPLNLRRGRNSFGGQLTQRRSLGLLTNIMV